MRSIRPSLPVFVCGFARALSAGRRTCHAALAGPLPPFDNYPRACGLRSDPVLTVDGGKCKGRRANKPGPHTLSTMCFSLLSCVFDLAPDTFVLGVAVVCGVDAERWRQHEGMAGM